MSTRTETRSKDGTKLVVYTWTPVGKVHGRLLLVHGLSDHLGRWEDFGKAMSKMGVEVRGCDLRGHGLSEGLRTHVRRWSDYLEDVDAIAGEWAGKCTLMGHSMGSLVALDWLRKREAKRVILSGPLLGVYMPVAGWKTLLAPLLSRFAPSIPIPNGIDTAALCSIPSIVEAWLADPLTVSTATPRWFTEMKKALARVHAHADKYILPLDLHLAEHEQIVNPQAARDFAGRWGGSVNITGWPGAFHEIHKEPCGPALFQALSAFARGEISSDQARVSR